MEVKIISKEIIKPSVLIPIKPRSFKMSLVDQLCPPYYVRRVFFYHTNGFSTEETSQRLKSSLSETLTELWPFAGRVKDDFSIIYDDNDGGVEYNEARVLNSITLSNMLKNPIEENLKSLVTDVTLDYGTRPLVIVQSSFFECGGMALCLSVSHRISDGTTYATFMNTWAKTARGCLEKRKIIGGDRDLFLDLFPPGENMLSKASNFSHTYQSRITKRFVFSSSSIATLQDKASSSTIKCPTRFEAVSSLLWKTALSTRRKRMGPMRTSVSLITINLRRKISPPLPDHSIGNHSVPQTVQAPDGDIVLSELVCLIRGEIMIYDMSKLLRPNIA